MAMSVRRAAQVDPADARRLLAVNSLLLAELQQEVVDVRQVVGGHVVDEEAQDFVVADAPIDPAHEQH